MTVEEQEISAGAVPEQGVVACIVNSVAERLFHFDHCGGIAVLISLCAVRRPDRRITVSEQDEVTRVFDPPAEQPDTPRA